MGELLGSAMQPYRRSGSQFQSWQPASSSYWKQQTNPSFNISAPGGSTDFDERTGVYRSTGTPYPPQQGRSNQTIPFAPAVRQWNEATGQYGYNPGYGPSPGGGAMALPQGQPQTWQQPPPGYVRDPQPFNMGFGYEGLRNPPQGQPQNWPAVPGSGGGYLSAPSGGGQVPQQMPFVATPNATGGWSGHERSILPGYRGSVPPSMRAFQGGK